MNIAIYVRVSTGEQTTENQLLALEQLCQQRGWTIIDTYSENESAWQAGHQTELKRLTECARQGKYNVLLVWALDRLSREGALAILKLVDKFKKYGVKIISYQESWTEAPGEIANILYAITGWVARMESQRRSERIKAGINRAKQSGKGKRGKDTVRRKRRYFRKP
jgi:DNA invertase Pin-like site-specific DNA recombinase